MQAMIFCIETCNGFNNMLCKLHASTFICFKDKIVDTYIYVLFFALYMPMVNIVLCFYAMYHNSTQHFAVVP